MEAMYCGALVMEPSVTRAKEFFVPGQHYVAYDDVKDLANKLTYYLQNDDERENIARQGCRQIHQNFGPNAWWSRVAKELEIL